MLRTHERIFLAELVGGAESGDFGVDVPDRIDAETLKQKLRPTPADTMAEALEAIARPTTPLNAARMAEIADAALKLSGASRRPCTGDCAGCNAGCGICG